MSKKKYFILLPDGIGLRNFAYTSFQEITAVSEEHVTFWNGTPFELDKMGYSEIKAPTPRLHKLTEVYKNVRKNIELQFNIKRTNDEVYNSYKFPQKNSNLNALIKNSLTNLLTMLNTSESGLIRIRKKIIRLEKRTKYYAECHEVLKKERPVIVFCTNQRPAVAIAPIEAAKSLGIPTVSFIFSWDNLPKATLVVETDYYFVWSTHMKKELLFYYPYLKEQQVIITGTPQFEGHFKKEHLMPKEEFFKLYNLDLKTDYICFSGDDVTTSPNDPFYLEDTAKAVEKLNKSGHNIGIIFRRCPVDFSGRYDAVVEKYKEILIPVAPKWEKAGTMWNAIMPTKEDTFLLANTAEHTHLVINVGSSMVFDYACHEKPCAFINYDTDKKNHPTWNIEHIYKYVHFQSMPDKKAVHWLDSKKDISAVIIKSIKESQVETVKYAKDWFHVIAEDPEKASENIWNQLKRIKKESE